MAPRILLIEDDRPGMEVALYNLRSAEHEVTAASDGMEGLDLFSRGKFDLVITDVRMPGITGLDVARTIRKIAPDVPVIVITAFGGMETAVEAMKEGACYFLEKPFERKQLLLAVENTLAGRGIPETANESGIPEKEVEAGIICVFPRKGGSLRLCEKESDPSPSGCHFPEKRRKR